MRDQLIRHGDVIENQLLDTDRLGPQRGADLPPEPLLALQVPELEDGKVPGRPQQVPQPHLPRAQPGDPGPPGSVSFSLENILTNLINGRQFDCIIANPSNEANNILFLR